MINNNFSVIISLHKSDRADWFLEAAYSVLEQTVPPKTMFVTVDGELLSEHEFALNELKSRYSEIEIREVRRPQVNSRGVLLGEAVKEASDELIAIMDADDIAEPDRFARQLKYFHDNSSLDVVGGWIEEISPEDPKYLSLKKVPCEHAEIESYAKFRNPINNMTVMFKRNSVISAGNYVGKPNFADYWLWVRMLANGAKFSNIPEVLVRARAAEGMVDRRRGVQYLRSELNFIMSCHRLGFLSFSQAIFITVFRAPLRLLPNRVLGFVFNKFLR